MAAPLLLDDAQHRLVVSTCHPRSILAETAHVFPEHCTSAAIWKYPGALAGLERHAISRASLTFVTPVARDCVTLQPPKFSRAAIFCCIHAPKSMRPGRVLNLIADPKASYGRVSD